MLAEFGVSLPGTDAHSGLGFPRRDALTSSSRCARKDARRWSQEDRRFSSPPIDDRPASPTIGESANGEAAGTAAGYGRCTVSAPCDEGGGKSRSITTGEKARLRHHHRHGSQRRLEFDMSRHAAKPAAADLLGVALFRDLDQGRRAAGHAARAGQRSRLAAGAALEAPVRVRRVLRGGDVEPP